MMLVPKKKLVTVKSYPQETNNLMIRYDDII